MNRVISVSTIDELLASGQTQLRVFADNIITPLAQEYAAEKGVALVEGQGDKATRASRPPEAPAPPIGPSRVRDAVIAALGYEPEGLDEAIARAMVEESL